jgi:hypothetical protein
MKHTKEDNTQTEPPCLFYLAPLGKGNTGINLLCFVADRFHGNKKSASRVPNHAKMYGRRMRTFKKTAQRARRNVPVRQTMLHVRRNTSPCHLGRRRRRCSRSADTEAVGLRHAAVEGADFLEAPATRVSMVSPLLGLRGVDLLAEIIALLLRFGLLFETGEAGAAHHTAIADNPQTKSVDVAIRS